MPTHRRTKSSSAATTPPLPAPAHNPNHTPASGAPPPHPRPRSNSLLPRTHHCPICHRLSKHRCYIKGHLESCELHPGHVRRAGWGCPGCEAEGERRFYAERRERGKKGEGETERGEKDREGEKEREREKEKDKERTGAKMKGKSKGERVRFPPKRSGATS